MTLQFLFLDLHQAYDGRDFSHGSVSGTESCTMLLAEALSRRGHQVTVCNNRELALEVNGVRYRPLADASTLDPEMIAISNNRISVLGQIPMRRRVVWAHLDLRLRRLKKKHDLLAVFRVRPHLVVPSRYSALRTQAIVPFRSRQIIEHGVDSDFIQFSAPTNLPPPIAVFASQPGRNLNLVLKAWREQIHPHLPEARLHVYLPKPEQNPGHIANQEDNNIEVRGSIGKAKLAEAFRNARVMIYPGHKEETFCNAAAEAVASGLPVVTMGIGALGERVRHGVDGFVVPTAESMGEHALRLLVDNSLWRRMQRAGIEGSREKSWDVRAIEWEHAAAGWF
jgi:glycosyltransferase involved in cell wall biosynthesis